MKAFSLYALRSLVNKEMRYVGITAQRLDARLKQHCREHQPRDYKANWIQSLGAEPIIEPLVTGLSLEAAKEVEIAAIYFFRKFGVRLTNLSNGGDAFMAGRKHSAETKALMSEVHSGEKNHFFGKTHAPEALAKMSTAKKGKSSPMKGRVFSLEHRQKLSAAHLGKKTWNTGKTRFDFEQIKRLHSQGASMTEIAGVFHTGPGTISNIIRRGKSSSK